MRAIFGIYPSENYSGSRALAQEHRIIFDCWDGQSGGYFELIASYFEDFARKQNAVNIDSLNIRVVIRGDDLELAIAICKRMLSDFSKLSEQWRLNHGWIKSPGREDREIIVRLYRKRLLSVVHWMDTQFANAQRNHQCIVFGNGVFFRTLAGIPNDGALSYS